ncbi:hypothetical protein BX616_003377 [Lobosporangium transversale]|nr:hypothetical protein BX616_003377 [Lobosporangium transversale]
MKITSISGILCLAAAVAAINVDRSIHGHRSYSTGLEKRDEPKRATKHREHNVEAHNDGPRKKEGPDGNKAKESNDNDESDKNDPYGKNHQGGGNNHEGVEGKHDEEHKGVDKDNNSKGGKKVSENDQGSAEDKSSDANAPTTGKEEEKKAPTIGDGGKKAPTTGKEEGKKVPSTGEGGKAAPTTGKGGKTAPASGEERGTGGKEAEGGAVPTDGHNNNSNNKPTESISLDYTSPLWLVQPYGSSVWEQGRTYVIAWGPNPDAEYAKNLKSKTLVDIRLMQGPKEDLREVAVLKRGVDESVHSFQWTVPTALKPANDYTIRVSHEKDLDTYSHYFEIVKAGDPRSSKSNVGEPIQLPQKGDSAQTLDKGPIIKPANPPNPFPLETKDASKDKKTPNGPEVKSNNKPARASSASETQSANIMAFALTLFGAVYFL